MELMPRRPQLSPRFAGRRLLIWPPTYSIEQSNSANRVARNFESNPAHGPSRDAHKKRRCDAAMELLPTLPGWYRVKSASPKTVELDSRGLVLLDEALRIAFSFTTPTYWILTTWTKCAMYSFRVSCPGLRAGRPMSNAWRDAVSLREVSASSGMFADPSS